MASFKSLKFFIIASVVLSLAQFSLAQDSQPQTRKDKDEQISKDKVPESKSLKESKPSKTDPLGDLFKRAEEQIKDGQHCGPAPEPKQSPIA